MVETLIGGGFVVVGVLLTLAGTELAERRRAAREREARLHSARQDLYSRFLAHVGVMAEWVNAMKDHPDYPLEEVEATGRQRPNRDEWTRTAARLAAEINLVGGEDLVKSALIVRGMLYFWAVHREQHHESGVLDDPDLDLGGDDVDVEQETRARALRKHEALLIAEFDKSHSACVRAMRKDLGAPDISFELTHPSV